MLYEISSEVHRTNGCLISRRFDGPKMYLVRFPFVTLYLACILFRFVGWVSSSSALVVVRVVLFPFSLLSYIYIYIYVCVYLYLGILLCLIMHICKILLAYFVSTTKKVRSCCVFFFFFGVVVWWWCHCESRHGEREREIVSE